MKPDDWYRGAYSDLAARVVSLQADAAHMREALRIIVQVDGPGADLSPGGPCYDIARAALDRIEQRIGGDAGKTK